MALSYTPNCARRAGADRSTDRRWRWFEQKRLGWPDGYRILLRIETRFWESGERIADVQEILDCCRRSVLVELGRTVRR
jgi:hypothetical protein